MRLRSWFFTKRRPRSITGRNRRGTRQLAFEPCESRQLLAANPLSSSFHSPAASAVVGSSPAASAAPRAPVLAANLTAYRPQQTSGSYAPFAKTAVADHNPGIRINGDDDNGNGIPDRLDTSVTKENDLIEISVQASGTSYVLQRTDANLRLWTLATKGKGKELVFDASNRTAAVTFPKGSTQTTVWAEWTGAAAGTSTLTLQPASGAGPVDSLTFHTLQSVTFVFGGETFSSKPPPPDPSYGVWKIGAQLYAEGYDVHLHNEGELTSAYKEAVDAIHSQGMTQVAAFGFSHGGGDVYTLADKLNTNRQSIGTFSIAFTGYVDAVRNTSNFDTQVEARRPPGSLYHANYYRSQGIASELYLHGVASQGAGAGFQLDILTTSWGAKATHTGSKGISALAEVQSGIHDQLVQYVTV